MVVEAAALRVELCGIPLRNPLIPAAGTLSKETLGEASDAYGAVLPKTVTPGARRGNPPPRIAEAASGMVNSIGLQNPGIDGFLHELGGYEVGLPVFVSVAGDTAEEFSGLCARLASEPRVSAVELNLSCPNVEHGGLTFCAGPESVEGVVAGCRSRMPGKPLLVKLANEGVRENSLAAEGAGADALTLINTIPALTVDAHRREVLLKGGLSGPAIKPVALRSVYEVARLVDVPVIGCGGVASGTDVVEFMLAGAAAVQVGSSSFAREPVEILSELSGYLRGAGSSAAALTGALRERERVV